MNKSVLLSIKPKYCELIASGKKTVEIRKNRPKIDTPFKCYIYCTKPKHITYSGSMCLASDELYRLPNGEIKYGCSIELAVWDNYTKDNFLNCKVIGEFVCDDISENDMVFGGYGVYDISDDALQEMCLTNDELWEYGKGETLYGWHISDLVIYDEPKELGEFKAAVPNHFCKYRNDYGECCGHHFIDCEYMKKDTNPDGSVNIYYCDKRVARPPQSWCYVEELEVSNEAIL